MLKKKSIRILLLVIGIIILIGGSGLAYYRLSRIQGIIEPSAVNETLKGKKDVPQIIIYTQDRGFKNEVMKNITDKISSEEIYLEIQPVEVLADDVESWDKIVLFTTITSSEPPENVLAFIKKNKANPKVAAFLTADSGKWAHQPDDIDAFTAASRNGDNESSFTEKILTFIKE
jgi:hypothetical protein